ncbi:transposase [Butyrivibrio sp.]|uniref:transposase n=1 Tax=Butyrivibrio sp. TaxID=28121 RepID=UPI0025C1EDF6|nr:transposase [Butyrivibrio sp.]MBQ9303888.1 transposase [Butyrivibrio sp.]
MYYAFTSKNGYQYASAATSKRDGKDTSVSYKYIGRVVDLSQQIFYSREKDYFTYDITTDKYGPVPESFSPPKKQDKRKRDRKAFDFGDSFLLNAILAKSGFWEVVDKVPWKNKDTLHAMVIFYMTSRLANCYANMWYQGNIIHMLCPDAYLDSSGISDFLEKIGTPESLVSYHKAYVDFVFEQYHKDKNVLIDSMGLPSKSRMYLTKLNVHNGKLSLEARLVIVAQKSTGIPLYFQLVPGNINDAMTLKPIKEHCSELGIDIDGYLLDAGYSTDINLDEFYNEKHECVIPYITRPKALATYYKEALKEILPGLESREHFVQYMDRYVFIQHTKVKVGKGSDQPAYLYVGLDTSRLSDELHKLIKRAAKNGLNIDQVYEGMENQGIFALLSGVEISDEDILPEYYLRQGIEQLNDIAKNYTKLLPERCHKVETFQGHVLLSMIGTAIIRFIQIQLNDSEKYLGSRIEALRTQKVICYDTKIVPDAPEKLGNDVYKAFGITCPQSIPITSGKLNYIPPQKVKHLFKVPKKRAPKKAKLEATENNSETSADAQTEEKKEENPPIEKTNN